MKNNNLVLINTWDNEIDEIIERITIKAITFDNLDDKMAFLARFEHMFSATVLEWRNGTLSDDLAESYRDYLESNNQPEGVHYLTDIIYYLQDEENQNAVNKLVKKHFNVDDINDCLVEEYLCLVIDNCLKKQTAVFHYMY